MGYIDFDLRPLFWLAGLGLLALGVGTVWGLVSGAMWLIEHVRLV